MPSPIALTEEAVVKEVDALEAFCKGVKPKPQLVDNVTSWPELADLSAAAVAADAAIKSTPNSPAVRAAGNYANAIARDALYTFAGRKFLQAVATQKQFVNLYQLHRCVRNSTPG